MLDGIFAVLFVIAFVITYLTEDKESVVYGILGFVFWIVLFVQSLYIVDIAGNVYAEFGVSAICLALVFIQLILLIIFFTDWKKAKGMP